jgi:hypothetical protein
MASTVEQIQRRRQRFAEQGLCHLCGKEPPLKDHKAGRDCLLKRNAQKVAVREQAFFGGMCQGCRINPVKDDLRHCEDCLRQAHGRAAATPYTLCEVCGESTNRKKARWCDKHRPAPGAGKRKYKADARIAELIKGAYAQGEAARKSGEKKSYLTCLAETIGWPYWAVQAEARRLGVTRIKESNWSNQELTILERNAHWTPTTIRKRLKEQGYYRSLHAIENKRNRLNLFKSHDYMSPYDLAKHCFRVSPDTVKRWMAKGWLRTLERKDVERNDTCHWIKQQWVYDFVVKHPLAFDIKKVDQLWFIDLLTSGNVGVKLQESKDSKPLSITEMERNEFGGE